MSARSLATTSLLAFAAACGGDEAPSLALVPIVVLGDTAGPGMFASEPFTVARAADGRYLVGAYSNELVRVFDSTGAYLSSIGKLGPGPEEYSSPNLVMVDDDGAIVIMDSEMRARTELTPDLAFRRRDRLGGSALWFSELLSDGSYVLNRPVLTPDGGPSILSFARDGTPLGDYEEPVAPCKDPNECMWSSPRIFAGDGAGGLWAARPVAWPAVFRYDSSGNLLRQFDLDLEWFPHAAPKAGADYPTLSSMWVDHDGRLWLAGRSSTGSTDSMLPGTLGRVDVMDSITGSPIAAAMLGDANLVHLLGDAQVAAIVEDSAGYYRVRIYRAVLRDGS